MAKDQKQPAGRQNALPVLSEPKSVETPAASAAVPVGRRCETCAFRDAAHKCRRFPPVIVTPSGGLWAGVGADDWCGEHQPK